MRCLWLSLALTACVVQDTTADSCLADVSARAEEIAVGFPDTPEGRLIAVEVAKYDVSGRRPECRGALYPEEGL